MRGGRFTCWMGRLFERALPRLDFFCDGESPFGVDWLHEF